LFAESGIARLSVKDQVRKIVSQNARLKSSLDSALIFSAVAAFDVFVE
jgi:hypothetical protein